MKYEDMHFSEEDKAQLRKNKDAIIAWIKENVVPYLSPTDSYDRILIEFGGKYRSPRDYGEEVANYRISVYGSEQTFRSGGGRETKGMIGYGQRYGGIGESMESLYSPYDIYPIVDNWQYLKGELLGELREKTKVSKQIAEFTV